MFFFLAEVGPWLASEKSEAHPCSCPREDGRFFPFAVWMGWCFPGRFPGWFLSQSNVASLQGFIKVFLVLSLICPPFIME